MAVHFAPRTYFCIKNGLVFTNYHDLHVYVHRLETGIHCLTLESEVLNSRITQALDSRQDLAK